MSTTEAFPASEIRELGTFAPRFAEAFTRASERRLRALYDDIAPMLSERFHELRVGGAGQLEVLNRVARLVGLKGLDVSKPLPDDADEALAQRVGWRSPARWAVLSLLWTLVEVGPDATTPCAWADVAYRGDGRRPRSESLLSDDDEPIALALAAARLAGSPSVASGLALALLNLPVVIRAEGDTSVAAHAVLPLALLESSRTRTATSNQLAAGDRLLLADEDHRVALEGDHEAVGDMLTITGDARLDPATRMADIVPGLTLLYEGNAGDDRR